MNNDQRKNPIMRPAICTQCGGHVDVDAQGEKAICPYCGMQFIVEKAINTYNVQHASIGHVDSITINKPGALESVFRFVEDQQKRADDQRKEHQKFLKKNWWLFLVMLFIPFVFLTVAYLEEKRSNKITINYSSNQLEGKHYNDVVTRLQNNGFVNIRTEAKKDIVFGWLAKDGDVARVEINGADDFPSGTKFPQDADIIVIYHTFR